MARHGDGCRIKLANYSNSELVQDKSWPERLVVFLVNIWCRLTTIIPENKKRFLSLFFINSVFFPF